jgi:pimeloyl-ACP methyl ester carboxylesterase
MKRLLFTAVATAILAAAGAAVLLTADRDLVVHQEVVQGVPLTEVRLMDTVAAPGVVVAHGFAGSARLMMPFADSLARRGFVVVLLDFPGNGRNTAGGDHLHALDVAVGYLRDNIEITRIALVGHSMGAAAVTRYAATHPEVESTVAISLGEAEILPRRLLVIVGGLEFRVFRETAQQASAGDERRLVVVPGVEHIAVLFAPRTHAEILQWLEAPPGPVPRPWLRLLGGGLLMAAFGVGLYPLAMALRREGRAQAPPTSLMVAAPAAGAIGVIAAAVLPQAWLPLQVGAYVTGFAAVSGAVMVLWSGFTGGKPWRGKLFPPHLLFIGYSVGAVAIPIHFGLTHAAPVGPRWWILPIVVAAFALLAYGSIAVAGDRAGRMLLVAASGVVALTAAAVIGLAPGFIMLILPLLVLLLGWQAIWTPIMLRAGAPAWLVAVAGAILPAWPTATAMPLLIS